ncbi:MAG: hypothetical protein K6A42_00655 [Treponema sp.]|nr:hypothetical protein [Treponema sp.]
MNRNDIDFIQSGIDYNFKNLQLLEQAFTRKSYSSEHPGTQDNEVLEFYGDEILDFFVTKKLYKKFSKFINNELVSEKDEGELTKLKSIIVSKNSLAQCMHNFGFSNFLYLGNSDKENNVQNSISVNEDLFEAIIGAVAADCDWDYNTLEKVCNTMLQFETINNYLAILVAEKSNALGFGTPEYKPMSWQIKDMKDMPPYNLYNQYLKIEEFGTPKNPKTGNCEYYVNIGGNCFKGIGNGILQAKLNADEQAYRFLCKEEIKRKFEKINYNNPASTLHELFQKKVIMEVRYEFNEYHDENGNPIWNCKAILEGYGEVSSDNISKKQAKQDASLKLLHRITESKIEIAAKPKPIVHFLGMCALWSDEQKSEAEKKLFKNYYDGETSK